MTQPFQYSTTYTLDKNYFTECFQDTVKREKSIKAYGKAIAFIIVGLSLLIFTSVGGYAAAFIFALGIVEALSVRFQKAWWVTRQNYSRAANSQVNLTIDETGIGIKSSYVENNWLWTDVDFITATEHGWIITVNSSRSYLSNKCLSEEARAYLNTLSLSKSVK